MPVRDVDFAADALYYLDCEAAISMGGDRFVVVGDGGRVVEIDGLAAAALRACRGAKTLQEHASTVWQEGGLGVPDRLVRAFETLIDAKVLVPVFKRSDAGTVTATTNEQVATVAIVTADRPSLLARSIKEVSRTATASGRSVRIIVLDGSNTQAQKTREVVAHCGVDAIYVGRLEAGRMLARLPFSLEPELNGALEPGCAGSSRNLALLLTAGEKIVMVDDDVLCRPWQDVEASHGVAFNGHDDLRRWRFFRSRAEALDRLPNCDGDLLGTLGAILGRSLSGAVDLCGAADWQNACGHMVSTRSTACSVRVAMTGLAGDSGRDCHGRLLLHSGGIREALVSGVTAAEIALCSREVQCIAQKMIVTHDPSCMTYCCGLDNRQLLPPFPALRRGEDTVFGVLLGLCEPKALFAHLPMGVVHDSNRDSAIDPDLFPSASQARLADVLGGLVQAAGSALVAQDLAGRMRSLGQLFIDLAEGDLSDVMSLVIRSQLQLRGTQLVLCETALAMLPERPERLYSGIERYRSKLVSAVTSPEFFVPSECAVGRDVLQGYRNLQSRLRHIGLLLRSWPTLWSEARALGLSAA